MTRVRFRVWAGILGILALPLISIAKSDGVDELLRGLWPKLAPGADEGLRGSPNILDSIRPRWIPWKKNIQATFPDSVLDGRGLIEFSIAPNGTVIHAKFIRKNSLDTTVSRMALEMIRGVKFREMKTEQIDTSLFPILLRNN
jgi:hypothetical protein